MDAFVNRRVDRRFVLGAAGAGALAGAWPGRPAKANAALLLAIAPAIVTGVFSLLAANVHARRAQRNESSAAESRFALAMKDLQNLQSMLIQEYRDLAWRGRALAVERWFQPATSGDFSYRIAGAGNRPLTAPASEALHDPSMRIGFEEGFVRLNRGSSAAFMHGGELQVATDWLRKTGRMPVPLDEPVILPNAQLRVVRAQLAQMNGVGQDEFDRKYAVFGSRPYSGGGRETSYWLHSVVDAENYQAGRPQNVGFIETT